MIDDSSTEWLNVTESSWIHFKLHWINASGFKCDSLCTGSRTTQNFWWNFGDQILTGVRDHGHSSTKASITMSLTVGVCVHYAFKCVFTCVLTHLCLFSIEGYFWGSNCVKFSSQIWANEFDTKCACSVFVKSNFVAKCTCKNFALKWLSCRSRAVASFSGVDKVENEIWSL